MTLLQRVRSAIRGLGNALPTGLSLARALLGQTTALALLLFCYLVFLRPLNEDQSAYMLAFYGLSGLSLAVQASLMMASRAALGQRFVGLRALGIDRQRWAWGPALRWWGLSLFTLLFLPASFGLIVGLFFGENDLDAANSATRLVGALGLLVGLWVQTHFLPFFLRRAFGDREIGLGQAWHLLSTAQSLLWLCKLAVALAPAIILALLWPEAELAVLLLAWGGVALFSAHCAAELERWHPRPVGVKICGVRTAEIVETAIIAGADMLGFVFVKESPRYLTPQQAAPLVAQAKGRSLCVGLTAERDVQNLQALLDEVPLDLLQIHAPLEPHELKALTLTLGLPIIPVVQVAQASDLRRARAYSGLAPLVLFDTAPPDQSNISGGNGIPFDASWLSRHEGVPAMLAGGLTPETVRRAIQRSGAQAVDVSSGVEQQRGVKDPARIRAFLAAAKGVRLA